MWMSPVAIGVPSIEIARIKQTGRDTEEWHRNKEYSNIYPNNISFTSLFHCASLSKQLSRLSSYSKGYDRYFWHRIGIALWTGLFLESVKFKCICKPTHPEIFVHRLTNITRPPSLGGRRTTTTCWWFGMGFRIRWWSSWRRCAKWSIGGALGVPRTRSYKRHRPRRRWRSSHSWIGGWGGCPECLVDKRFLRFFDVASNKIFIGTPPSVVRRVNNVKKWMWGKSLNNIRW